jgi:hypothetical protein
MNTFTPRKYNKRKQKKNGINNSKPPLPKPENNIKKEEGKGKKKIKQRP